MELDKQLTLESTKENSTTSHQKISTTRRAGIAGLNWPCTASTRSRN